MVEGFAILTETIGNPIYRQEVPPSSIERYRGKLPDPLLELWKEHGWCGYGEGIFWLVNPQEYEGILNYWISNIATELTDTYHVIARSAFGDLYLWGEKTGPSLNIYSNVSRFSYDPVDRPAQAATRALQAFLLSLSVEYLDFDDFFSLAKKKLGILSQDEIYGFTPALMLGGAAKLENIEKLKAVEHLTILSQLAELEPYTLSDL